MKVYSFPLPDNREEKFSFISFEKHFDRDDRLASEMHSKFKNIISESIAIILRPPVEIQLDPEKQNFQQKYQKVIERFGNLPLYLLYSKDFNHEFSKNINDGAISLEKTDIASIVSVIKQKELEEFILKSNAIIRSPLNSIFRTPSFEYAYNFLRVGNIQISRDVLDAIFFWVLPYLKNKDALLTDSWSISSTALNISRLLYRYVQSNLMGEQNEDLVNWARNFHVDFLSTFYHGKRSMTRETKDILAPLIYNDDLKILFLFSATKTERSINAIKKEIDTEGYSEKIEYLSLYNLLNVNKCDSLCSLTNEDFLKKSNIHPVGFKSVDRPIKSETVIVIDEKSFFPTRVECNEVLITRKAFKEHRNFFINYSGNNVISIHRNAYFTNNTQVERHHGIFIDVGEMIKTQVFLTKLKVIVEGFDDAPKMVIFPPHTQGIKFVEKICSFLKEKFGRIPQQLCFADLENLAPALKEQYKQEILKLSENDLILVIDDVCTTGSRVKGFQKILRELPFPGKISYLIGVARLTSNKDLITLERDLTYPRHEFLFVENIYLPTWYDNDCPWCQEIETIKELLRKPIYEEFRRPLILRKTELENATEVGLENNCFIDIKGKPKFQQGSIAPLKKDATEAEVVACFSAAIQTLRNIDYEEETSPNWKLKITKFLNRIDYFNSRKNAQNGKLGIEYPLYRILRIKDYLGDTFNEALIKASIIRSAVHSELYSVSDLLLQDQKKRIKDFIDGKNLNQNEINFFKYELFLALKQHKLPKPDMQEKLREILRELFIDE